MQKFLVKIFGKRPPVLLIQEGKTILIPGGYINTNSKCKFQIQNINSKREDKKRDSHKKIQTEIWSSR
jgi:hypothetical protein